MFLQIAQILSVHPTPHPQKIKKKMEEEEEEKRSRNYFMQLEGSLLDGEFRADSLLLWENAGLSTHCSSFEMLCGWRSIEISLEDLDLKSSICNTVLFADGMQTGIFYLQAR